MTKTRRITLIAATLAVAALATVAAVAAWPQSSAEAKSDFCNSLRNFQTTVVSYQGLDPRTATDAQLETASNDVTDAWNQVEDDANDWANAYDNPLGNAYDDLYWAYQGLPEDNTIAEDINDLQPELNAFPDAFRETFDGSGCAEA